MINKKDSIFLAHRMETFIDLVQDPQAYLDRNQDVILPESFDLKITSAALYLLGDCYLRGRGLKMPLKSTGERGALETLNNMFDAVRKEVEARPYMYPKLQGVLGRGQAAMEVELKMDGFSFWSEDEDE
jgi:hypothetical protein